MPQFRPLVDCLVRQALRLELLRGVARDRSCNVVLDDRIDLGENRGDGGGVEIVLKLYSRLDDDVVRLHPDDATDGFTEIPVPQQEGFERRLRRAAIRLRCARGLDEEVVVSLE